MVVRIDAAVLDPEDCVLVVAMRSDGTAYVQVDAANTPAEVAAALREMADRFDAEGVTEQPGPEVDEGELGGEG